MQNSNLQLSPLRRGFQSANCFSYTIEECITALQLRGQHREESIEV